MSLFSAGGILIFSIIPSMKKIKALSLMQHVNAILQDCFPQFPLDWKKTLMLIFSLPTQQYLQNLHTAGVLAAFS